MISTVGKALALDSIGSFLVQRGPFVAAPLPVAVQIGIVLGQECGGVRRSCLDSVLWSRMVISAVARQHNRCAATATYYKNSRSRHAYGAWPSLTYQH